MNALVTLATKSLQKFQLGQQLMACIVEQVVIPHYQFA